MQTLDRFLAERIARSAGRTVHRQLVAGGGPESRLLCTGSFTASVLDRRRSWRWRCLCSCRVGSDPLDCRCSLRILGTLAAFVLLVFIPGQTINHQGTYAVQILATIFAFMVLTLRVPWLALLFIALAGGHCLGDLCVQPAARSCVLAAAGSLRRRDAPPRGLFTRAAVHPNPLAIPPRRATACRDAPGGRSRNGRSSRRRHPPDERRSAPGACR